MKLEDIKNEYPSIPNDIHRMIEEETAKQIELAESRKTKHAKAVRTSTGSFRKKRWSPWRIAAVVIIGILATGTVAYAGTRLYQLRLEKQGSYGLDMELVTEEAAEPVSTEKSAAIAEDNQVSESTDTDQSVETASSEAIIPDTLEETQLVFGYIPEGMEQINAYQLASADGRAVSAISFLYDEGDPDQVMHLTNVVESETFESAALAAVYTQISYGDYDQRAYLFFPDQFKVVTLMAKDLSKEDVIQIAASLSLERTGETISTEGLSTWSDRIREEDKRIAYKAPTYEVAMATRYAYMPEGKVHQIGESFPMQTSFILDGKPTETEALYYCVDQVDVLNDISALDPAFISDDEFFVNFIGEDGSLLPAELHFYTRGNGIDSTLEEVYETSVDTKIVYVTLTLNNTGDVDLENVLLHGTLRPYLQTNGFDQIDGNSLTEEAADYLNGIYYNSADLYQGDFDLVRTQFDQPLAFGCEMQYYDFSSYAVGDGGNHVPLISAGESLTVHLGFLVSEDMLPYLYLDLGSWEYQLQNGIDIRQ